MSFLQGFFDSLGSVFADPVSPRGSNAARNPNSTSMDGSGIDTSVVNERIAYKLKGYFDLAKEEIAKAVRAEEWGLVDDAVLHYGHAQRILAEGASTRAPSYITPSEQQKVNSYHQKISKWQSQVDERLRALNRRTGGTSADKITKPRPQPARVLQKPSNSAMNVRLREPSFGGNTAGTRAQTSTASTSKSDKDDEKLVEMINTVIVDRSPSVNWDDIAGLEKAKQTLFEMVILPTKRRDLFTGLRRPPRGLLLFGPPGNGKTMLAKAVASQSDATFFNVSASSLTSKWVGEGEKLVRTLFMVAISRQPSVIFMDEIDSIMSTRVANEHDASRRLKSEFLVQFDGVTSNSDDLVIVIGATNKPQELDDAVLRRLSDRSDEVYGSPGVLKGPLDFFYAPGTPFTYQAKKIYIPLPDQNVRRLILTQKLKGQAFKLPGGDLERLARETDGYSGSDLQALCEEAAMMPIREFGANILTVKANQVRPLRYDDFRRAMAVIRPSLQKSKWEELERWNEEFGAN